MSKTATVLRIPSSDFGEPNIVEVHIDMNDGLMPASTILSLIRKLVWNETLTINSIIQIDQRGHRNDPNLYGHIVGQAAMTDIHFGSVATPSSSLLAAYFTQGSLLTTYANEKHLKLMSRRDAITLGLIEDRDINDKYCVYTEIGLANLAKAEANG